MTRIKRFSRVEFDRRVARCPAIHVDCQTLQGPVGPPEFIRRFQLGSVVVIEWPNRTLTRGDVRLDLAKRMTYREAAGALGLLRKGER